MAHINQIDVTCAFNMLIKKLYICMCAITSIQTINTEFISLYLQKQY